MKLNAKKKDGGAVEYIFLSFLDATFRAVAPNPHISSQSPGELPGASSPSILMMSIWMNGYGARPDWYFVGAPQAVMSCNQA